MGTSLIAAFAAGIVALFAPCCITFLLPAYLGSVFKEKEKVFLMTVVFGLGISVVLLPAVLGVAILSQALFSYHDQIYIAGSVVMLIVGFLTMFNVKLPMPMFAMQQANNKADIGSIFMLGVFSGITSACCAPVLIGILTLTFLSPSFFGAMAIGAMYVFGMVLPLLVIAAFFSGKVAALSVLRKKVGRFIVSNLIAALIFLLTGSIMLVLTLQGKLAMGNIEGFTKTIQDTAMVVDRWVGASSILNVLFALFVIFVVYRIAKKL